MIELYIAIFLLSAFSVWLWIKANRKIVGIDINKLSQPKITESTGIALLIPLWTAIAYFEIISFSIDWIAFGLLVTGFTIIGFLDDTKHKWSTSSTPWMSRAMPIAVICLVFAGIYSQNWLWIIPIALFIAGLASFQNTFAGLNGWQGGSGLIIAVAVSFLLAGTAFQAFALALAAIILGFLAWNKFPARVFEGDSGTLLIGSCIAGLLVMNGKIELMLLALLFYIPHIVDFLFLKILTNRSDPSQQRIRPYRLLKDSRLAIPEYPDKKTRFDFAKLIIRIFGPLKEWQIVAVIWIVVAANALIWLFAFGFLRF
ncbi:MAG: hypothetical protein Q7R70_05940 [Candidatus Diapherotrites archaeon]|nr:hypothetical protein [Candidatus Diapherotrites archaeon]